MKLAVVLPRNMHFGPRGATAIDLSARDYARFSRFADTMTLVAEQVDEPFAGPTIRWFRTGDRSGSVRILRELLPDMILVEQHRPTASAIARAFPGTPVVMHRHGALKRPKGSLAAWLARRSYDRFAGIIAKSRAVGEEMVRFLPGLKVPLRIVGNGLDVTEWHPSVIRENEILFVGRLSPDKGVLQAAEGVVAALGEHQGWRASFIFTETDRFPDYRDSVLMKLGALSSRVGCQVGLPHSTVKSAFESAAIAVVPSVYVEAFGRTALEAMAGGAALITSGRGGLAEVAGRPEEGASITLPEITAEAVARAVSGLVEAPETRRRIAAAGRARAETLFDIRRQATLLDDALVEFSNDYKLRHRP